MNVRYFGAEIAGGKNIGGEDGLVVGDFLRKLNQANVCEWDASKFGLQSMKGTGIFRSTEKSGAGQRAVGIGVVALRVVTGAAVRTVTASDGGRNYDAIAGFYIANAFADFFDDTDAFMTENSSFLHTRHGATHEMQIGAADSAGGQTHNGVEIVL